MNNARVWRTHGTSFFTSQSTATAGFSAPQAPVSTTVKDDSAASTSGRPETAPAPSGRIARLKATKAQSQPIQERERPLAEYMALPASQYSVLDARKIERLDDNTFRWAFDRVVVGQCSMCFASLQLGRQLVVALSICTILLAICSYDPARFASPHSF